MENADQQYQERVKIFQEFLDEDHGFNKYKLKIKKMFDKGFNRLIVNINDLRQSHPEYAQGILNRFMLSNSSPIDYIPAFEQALKDVVQAQLEPSVSDKPYYVGFEGAFGNNTVAPREICSRYLGKMIHIEGIVTRCTILTLKQAPSSALKFLKAFITVRPRSYFMPVNTVMGIHLETRCQPVACTPKRFLL